MCYNCGMDKCKFCGDSLVNIIYGYPTGKLIELAQSEGIALGGCTMTSDSPTVYCYGCNEAY